MSKFWKWLVVLAAMGGVWARGEEGPVLTNVQQVLDLGVYQARKLHLPVRLRGIGVMSVRNPVSVFVHDETGAIPVYGTNELPETAFGKLVEVEGVTESGLKAPIVVDAGIRVIQEARLPEPLRLPVARMMAGEGCWQYVRVEGVVRDMNRDVPNLALSIATEGRRVTVFYFGYNRVREKGLPLEWLEGRMRIDGVCWSDVNDRNQTVGFHMVVMDTNQLQMLGPGRTNLFELPLLGPGEAGRLNQASDERFRIAGTVVGQFPDDRLFLNTEFGPLEARLDPFISRGMPTTEVVPREPAPPLEPGDRVELVGAPADTAFAPMLLDAVYRRTGGGAAPASAAVQPGELTSGRHDAELVGFEARLLAHERRSQDMGYLESLVLEADNTVFEATWKTESTNRLPALPLNARLRVSGICLVRSGPADVRRTVGVLLRSPADVVYLGQPPFWASWPLRQVLIGLVVVVLASSIWIFLLRGQVQQRTAALVSANDQLHRNASRLRESEEEIQRALEQERELSRLKSQFVTTVSHEFRTPLGVIMSSAENLRDYHERFTSEQRAGHLKDIFDATRTMSRLMEEVLLLGRVEAGTVAIAPVPLDLPALCRRFIEEVEAANNGHCRIRFQYQPPPDGQSTRGDEGLLRHILVNLLSNAVKYSPAGSEVSLGMEFCDAYAVMTVRDRGIGILEEDVPRLFQAFHRGRNVGDTPGSGLGMVIVKRCVELLGGTIEFSSRVKAGSTFVVRLPMYAKPAQDSGNAG